ncbi:ABC transporter ATP-binding protein [Rhodoligotrophos defluvii]|uniref:ABC transporter ATP-binding protein n=1 Tax=Rhodoligotrophos defluvii TaxID=2561934 RepID=UPI0010C99E10|nr:ABC transporter ATP-binding protein [Rhodoligotrophos defluvii]
MLEIKGLDVTIGIQRILQSVSLEVTQGQIVTVLGSNGVGKTTLMRATMGIYRPSGGEILLKGERIDRRPTHEIVRLGIAQAPEGRHLFPNMTVAENMQLGGAVLPAQDYEAAFGEVVELFPIVQQRLQQKAGSLSGGEQQMVCIARALMARPKLLLLDEPSLGLAPKIVKLIFDLIVRIRERGTSILLVEQNAKAALKIADYAYVMDSGRITMEGRPSELEQDDRIRRIYLGG